MDISIEKSESKRINDHDNLTEKEIRYNDLNLSRKRLNHSMSRWVNTPIKIFFNLVTKFKL